MILNHINRNLDGQFKLTINEPKFNWKQSNQSNLIHILWNHSNQDVILELDGYPVTLPPESVLTSTFYHQVSIRKGAELLVIFSFNRQYYCIYDHDTEVSCNGIIFFGSQQQVIISLDNGYQMKMKLLLEMFVDEFRQKDNIQGEMLVVLLKRLIIICTRLAKIQIGLNKTHNDVVEIIRQFSFLVDMNFKKIKTVKEYSDLLHKSPKTISNVFSKIGDLTPLQIIHERIVLEARRLLTYTDKNINEITFDLGFEEPATFYKLFKKHLNESPQSFRNSRIKDNMGSIAI